MPSTLAITGANGFVGRHLVAGAFARGWDVRGVVRSPSAGRIVSELGGLARQVSGLRTDELVEALQGASVLVHLAQIGAERGSARFEDVNVEGTRNVLAAAREVGVRRVVFLSGLGATRYGVKPRCTNRYFLSKLTAEVSLFCSDLDVVVLRPSYVLGPGGELVSGLLQELRQGVVEQVGDGDHRLQPIAASDTAAAILAAAVERMPTPATVFDLVGPEALTYRDLVQRVARLAGDPDRAVPHELRVIRAEEADAQAAAGGYRGMLPEELDCLLCDEVASPQPLERLLGRPLRPLDDVLRGALEPAPPH